jgi:hypothetical protein
MENFNTSNLEYKHILTTLPPKDVIIFFNKQFLAPTIESKGFEFKEKQLEYHRKTSDFKQVIWHSCNRNNIRGHRISFEVGSYILSSKFEKWYKKNYNSNPIGGDVVLGEKLLFYENWSTKYSRPGNFGYDLITKDIKDQFIEILNNINNVIIPNFDFYTTFDKIIDNPKEDVIDGNYNMFPIFRQIEHCLFLGNEEKAIQISKSLFDNPKYPKEYNEYRDKELKRIFKK